MRTGRSLTICCSLLPGGACSGGGGACSWGVSAPGGSAPRGVCSGGDVCFQGGWVSQHALRQTPLPPRGQTHACENITLARLRCGGNNRLARPHLWRWCAPLGKLGSATGRGGLSAPGRIAQFSEKVHEKGSFPAPILRMKPLPMRKKDRIWFCFRNISLVESMTTQATSEMTCDLPLDLIKGSPGFSFDIGQ